MRLRVIPGGIALILAGCGLSVMGTPSDGGDAGASAGTPPVVLVPDAANDVQTLPPPEVDAGEDAGVDATKPCEGGPLECCGGAPCPAGTEACIDNKCVATLTITARIDGSSNLVLKGDKISWFHVSFDPPSNVKIDNTSWSTTFPNPPGDICNCKSSGTIGLSPPLPARPQNGALVQTDGRSPVTLDPATDANDHTLSVRFADVDNSDDDYAVTLTYETR